MRSLLAALVFYTILPLGAISLDFRRIARWLPLVGLVVGLLVAGTYAFAGLWFSSSLSALVAVVFWAWLTGGLHLDGLMDTADGWAAGRERGLAVMSDSRIGAYALIVAFAVLAAKVLALAELHQGALFALVWAAVVGRWGQLVAIGSYAYLRPMGKGRFLVDGLRPEDGLLGTAFLVVVGGATLLLNPSRAAAVAVLTGSTMCASLFCGWVIARRFGGQTGDTYGAIVEITEALVLVAATLVF